MQIHDPSLPSDECSNSALNPGNNVNDSADVAFAVPLGGALVAFGALAANPSQSPATKTITTTCKYFLMTNVIFRNRERSFKHQASNFREASSTKLQHPDKL
jgi:hypothetical protein